MAIRTKKASQGIDRYTRIVTAVSCTVFSLTCLFVVLFSGLRTPNGKLSGHNFAVVDSSKVQVRASGHTFRGLPDANDHSRHKDFYAFHLWNYCSGKIVNGTYSVDFCSEPQHSLYDLFRYWKVWGTHVLGERAQLHWLEQGPKLLYVPYSVAGCLAFLTSIMSLSSLANSKVGQIMLILSSLTFIAMLTTAITAEVTYNKLIRRADEEGAQITAKKVGQLLYIANWLGSASSLVALALWYNLANSNALRRAPTIDTMNYPRAHVKSVESPLSARPSSSSPVRRRFLGS